jgi:hypothetical protein
VLWYRAARGGVCEALPATGPPIGVLPDCDFSVGRVLLCPGDVLLFYSDGVTEAENAEAELFGTPRLIEALKANASSPAAALAQSVVDAVDGFAKGPRGDDLTLVVVKALPRTIPFRFPGVLERIAIESDHAPYLDEARTLAAAQGLDLVELTTADGSIISSAQWPARFGYKDEWVARMGSSGIQIAMLKREELPEEVTLALVAVRVVSVGEKSIFIAGGLKLDKDFLASIELPEGMRMLLYRNLQPAFSSQALTSAGGPPGDAEKFATLIERVKREQKELTGSVGVESFQATPLFGREKELLAVRLIGNSSAEMLSVSHRLSMTKPRASRDSRSGNWRWRRL